MIEVVLRNYLNNSNLSAEVFMERPAIRPDYYFLLEKSGSGKINQIHESDFIVQSYAPTLYEAAAMNEEIKEAMFNAVKLDEISAVELNTDYNYTNAESKSYRYQAVFVITHY